MLQSEQLRTAESLARGLNDSQLAWLSGFFAAKTTHNGSRTEARLPAASAVTILYGSETGNSKIVAEDLSSQLGASGISAAVADMANYRTAKLKKEKILLVVVSTHGDGDPPEPARPFFNFLLGNRAPRLPALRYCVLSLGDSSYEHFCRAGEMLDERLAQLGANKLDSTTTCDIDFDQPAKSWQSAMAGLLGKEIRSRTNGERIEVASLASLKPEAAPRKHGRNNPYDARVLANICLTGGSEHRKTHHLELSLESSGMVYNPGDSLGVWPENPSRQIERTAEALGLALDETLKIGDEEASVETWLRDRFEITRLTRPVLLRYAQLCGDEKMRLLAADPDAVRKFMQGRGAADLFAMCRPPEGTRGLALGTLRRLAPRLYSLASSNLAWEDEAHLLVGVDKYRGIDGTELQGVTSGHLASLAEGDSASVYLQSNEAFRLPEDDDAPMVMIGPGTGVAPFRAFVAEREEKGARGKNWLFFGEQRRRDDFYYQAEWQDRLRRGSLHELNVAFSRDRRDKVYVQHKMRKQSDKLWEWLQEGAHVYVCGDETHMARDVESALVDVYCSAGAMERDSALEQLELMRGDGRYCRDVY